MTSMAMVTSTPLTDAAEDESKLSAEEPADGYTVPQFGGPDDDNLCATGCYAIVDTGTSGT